MTPMIDVIFQLIIFFLCVSQFEKAESTQQVSLPEAQSPQARRPEEAEETRVVVNVLPTEEVLIAGQPVDVAELADLFLRKKQRIAPREVEVWIRADRQTSYRVVEPILLACARAGIWKVAFKVIVERGGES